MNNKLTLLILVLVFLAQLFVPVQMILNREDVLMTGTPYEFKTEPIDPNDPFRGKYITLNFEIASYEVGSIDGWRQGEKVFVHLINDEYGFAKIKHLSKEAPNDGVDYFKANVKYVIAGTPSELNIEFPFTRYYMEESKSLVAERIYEESLDEEENKVAVAMVYVKDGDAVLKDVLIEGESIRSIAKRRNNGFN